MYLIAFPVIQMREPIKRKTTNIKKLSERMFSDKIIPKIIVSPDNEHPTQ